VSAAKKTHEIDFSVPLCLILSDQNFPPSLPAIDGQCCVILRVEDALLYEFPGLLKEYFGSNLPGGSLVLFSSLVHLAARGLDSHAEDVVRTYKVLSKMIDRSCTVTHAVPVPLGGVGGGSMRDLYDLDSWLRRLGRGGLAPLSQTQGRFFGLKS
jgi:hypothetical protein